MLERSALKNTAFSLLATCSLVASVFVLPRAQAQPPIPIEEVSGAPAPGVSISTASIPAVPAAIAAIPPEDAQQLQLPKSQLPKKDLAEPLPIDSRTHLKVRPGVTELVPIARNYMNHIVTPFDDPKVITVNPIEFHKEGSSLYLATASERPVGIEIRSNDPDDTRGVSLALIPKAIPPRMITVQWEGESVASRPVSAARARRWEESAPYEEKLVEIAQTTARGEIPEGYSLTQDVEPLPCRLTNIKFVTGQKLTGSHYSVFVLKATNVGTTPLEIYGNAGCDMPGVVFVAPYPMAHLTSLSSTEVYVIASNESVQPMPKDNVRPSLLEPISPGPQSSRE